MDASTTGEIIQGLWRFEALLPDWTEPDGDEDGWEQSVAWWAVAAAGGIVLIDPLIDDWDALDALVAASGCAGVVRTCYWHQRSIADVVSRYDVPVWARRQSDAHGHYAFEHPLGDHEQIFDRFQIIDVERADEIALWLPRQRALVFGDAMILTRAGELRVCPDSWTQPKAVRSDSAPCSQSSRSFPWSMFWCPMVRWSWAEESRRCAAP
jgi:hypothetical protein